MNNIRNFCIIAHVDHGKSTLADRFLEITGTVEKRKMKEQFLDQLDLERERGITIKMAPVRMNYDLWQTVNGERDMENKNSHSSMLHNPVSIKQSYILNLIDTPGHSDFSYEVSRALEAVEGAILLVDATQGIQAQTLVNFNAAKKAGLTIIGAVNKIDVNPIGVDEVVKSTAELIGVGESEILRVSGKTGQGVEELLEKVIEKVPPPKNLSEQNKKIFQGLIFDSFYHKHKGVVAVVRVFSGEASQWEDALLLATNTKFKIKEIGHFAPELRIDVKIESGQIGYIATGLKEPELLKIGDTVFLSREPVSDEKQFALPGYKEPQPVVFVSFYPDEADDYENLKIAASKLKLNDSALQFDSDFNEFLGRGLKAGFLGKLHFEITAERLEKEFNIKTVHSFPSVSYKIKNRQGEWLIINNPKDFPNDYLEVLEPITKVEILTPPQYLGQVMNLQDSYKLSDLNTQTLGGSILISGRLPLADLVRDFDDRLKSVSAGYASLSYEVSEYQKTSVAKLEVLVAGHDVGGLTRIVHEEDMEREARKTVERLRDLLPKQQFSQAVQAVCGGKIVARETIPAMKKLLGNFGKTGGDITRKMKLWKKQKRGKEKLEGLAAKSKIDIPASIFKELLKK